MAEKKNGEVVKFTPPEGSVARAIEDLTTLWLNRNATTIEKGTDAKFDAVHEDLAGRLVNYAGMLMNIKSLKALAIAFDDKREAWARKNHMETDTNAKEYNATVALHYDKLATLVNRCIETLG